MKPRPNSIALALTLLVQLMLATGCASVSPPSQPVVVPPPAIPPLPAQARQPEPPPICSTGCSSGLTTLRTQLLDMLTPLGSLDSPANAPTTQ